MVCFLGVAVKSCACVRACLRVGKLQQCAELTVSTFLSLWPPACAGTVEALQST